jgi:hypothetical protein
MKRILFVFFITVVISCNKKSEHADNIPSVNDTSVVNTPKPGPRFRYSWLQMPVLFYFDTLNCTFITNDSLKLGIRTALSLLEKATPLKFKEVYVRDSADIIYKTEDIGLTGLGIVRTKIYSTILYQKIVCFNSSLMWSIDISKCEDNINIDYFHTHFYFIHNALHETFHALGQNDHFADGGVLNGVYNKSTWLDLVDLECLMGLYNAFFSSSFQVSDPAIIMNLTFTPDSTKYLFRIRNNGNCRIFLSSKTISNQIKYTVINTLDPGDIRDVILTVSNHITVNSDTLYFSFKPNKSDVDVKIPVTFIR